MRKTQANQFAVASSWGLAVIAASFSSLIFFFFFWFPVLLLLFWAAYYLAFAFGSCHISVAYMMLCFVTLPQFIIIICFLFFPACWLLILDFIYFHDLLKCWTNLKVLFKHGIVSDSNLTQFACLSAVSDWGRVMLIGNYIYYLFYQLE